MFQPELAGNLTLMIQALVLLFIGADLLILGLYARAKRAAAGNLGHRLRRRRHDRLGRQARRHGRPALPAAVDCDRRDGDLRPRVLHRPPPITQRSPLWPVALGLIGTLCGIAAVTRGVRRLGWLAVALGIVSMGLGILATESSVGHLNNVVVWSALFASMLRYATPLTWAAIGGMFSERSGVVNIALEGMMLAGAFFGILGAQKSGSWAIGPRRDGRGAGLALIHAFFSINLRADQIVSGTAINFLALGVTGYFFVDVYGELGTPSDIPRIPTSTCPSTAGTSSTGSSEPQPDDLGCPSRC